MTTAPARSPFQRAADANMVGAFELLVPYLPAPAGIRRFGEAVAVVTGVPSPFFNPIFALGDAVTERDLRDALEFSTGRGVRPSFQVRTDLEAPAAALATELRYLRDEPETPGLVLDPIPAAIPAPPPELAIAAVSDEVSTTAWISAAGALGSALARAFFADPAVRMVVGRVDGEPVTHAFVAATPGVIGVYAVGTVEAYRRRGYGAAITWAAIQAGRDAWGDRPVVLQASEMGDSVYRAMGFREFCRYAMWFPPKPPEASAA